MIAEVKAFPAAALTDVPAMLRQLAELIERGQVAKPEWALLVGVYPDESVAVFGWGEGRVHDRNAAIGVLERGKHELVHLTSPTRAV